MHPQAMIGLGTVDWDLINELSQQKPVTDLESYDFALITAFVNRKDRFVIRNDAPFYIVKDIINVNNINQIFVVIICILFILSIKLK